MKDRGMTKWQPFNACFSTKNVLEDISVKRQKEKMPILSEDQLKNIEQKILDAYFTRTSICIEYLYNGIRHKEIGFIEKIDNHKKEILINSKIIYFFQVLDANF